MDWPRPSLELELQPFAKPRHKDLHFCVAKERNQTNCISGCPKSVFEPNDGVVNGKHSKICFESTLQIKLMKTIKYSLPRKNESDMSELSWKTSKFWCLSAEKKLGGILGLSFPVTPPSFGLKPPGSVHQGWFLVPKPADQWQFSSGNLLPSSSK